MHWQRAGKRSRNTDEKKKQGEFSREKEFLMKITENEKKMQGADEKKMQGEVSREKEFLMKLLWA